MNPVPGAALERCAVLALALFLTLHASLPRGDRPAGLPEVPPAETGMDPERLARIDTAVQEALGRGQLPGAVVLVARQGKLGLEVRLDVGARLDPTGPAGGPTSADDR